MPDSGSVEPRGAPRARHHAAADADHHASPWTRTTPTSPQQRAAGDDEPRAPPRHWRSLVRGRARPRGPGRDRGRPDDREARSTSTSRAALIRPDRPTQRDPLAAAGPDRRPEADVTRPRPATAADDAEGQSTTPASRRRPELAPASARCTGPGVRITVDNRPGATRTSEIRDEDLATPGRRRSGRPAPRPIAINDQRINAARGIRNTNVAIHVNGRPLIAALRRAGDRRPPDPPGRPRPDQRGQEWFALVNGSGSDYDIENVDDIRPPGCARAALRDVIEPTPA